MGKCVNKRRFYIFITILVSCLGLQVSYLTLRPNHQTLLENFLHVSTLTSPAFYLNSPYLRHRDLNNIDRLYTFHPALRESEIGTFIISAPVKK